MKQIIAILSILFIMNGCSNKVLSVPGQTEEKIDPSAYLELEKLIREDNQIQALHNEAEQTIAREFNAMDRQSNNITNSGGSESRFGMVVKDYKG